MKKIYFVVCLMISAIAVKAQEYSYTNFSAGAGGGFTNTYGEYNKIVPKGSTNITVSYNPSPFRSISLEGQYGELAGGSFTSASGKAFSNNYQSLILHADFQVGSMIGKTKSSFSNFVKDFYVGGGIGVLSNSIATVGEKNQITDVAYTTNMSSVNPMASVKAGYILKIKNSFHEPLFDINFSYNFNTAFGTGLDGYAYARSFATTFTQHYSYCSVGFNIDLGKLKSFYQ